MTVQIEHFPHTPAAEANTTAEPACDKASLLIVSKTVSAYGKTELLACDGKCGKAWGINNRPKVSLSENDDDYAFLADDELGEAPEDPGTYEGGHGKPDTFDGPDRQNKWCARECERSKFFSTTEAVKLPDFTKRLYNMPSLHPHYS